MTGPRSYGFHEAFLRQLKGYKLTKKDPVCED